MIYSIRTMGQLLSSQTLDVSKMYLLINYLKELRLAFEHKIVIVLEAGLHNMRGAGRDPNEILIRLYF